MPTWKNITLYKFQRIDAIQAREDLDELDKILFTACEVFDMTEHELDSAGAGVASRLVEKVKTIFETPFAPKTPARIGKYKLLYDVSRLTFGQYIELSFFLQAHIRNAHLIMATISRPVFRRYRTEGHRKRSEFFLAQPVDVVMGGLKKVIENFEIFNKEYSNLFGLDKDVHDSDARDDRFNKRYGWTYSASVVAEYERITLDETYGLPIRQALNDLAYLKEKVSYEVRQHDRMVTNYKKQANGG